MKLSRTVINAQVVAKFANTNLFAYNTNVYISQGVPDKYEQWTLAHEALSTKCLEWKNIQSYDIMDGICMKRLAHCYCPDDLAERLKLKLLQLEVRSFLSWKASACQKAICKTTTTCMFLLSFPVGKMCIVAQHLPFATIQHAVNMARPGSTIRLHQGTFSGAPCCQRKDKYQSPWPTISFTISTWIL